MESLNTCRMDQLKSWYSAQSPQAKKQMLLGIGLVALLAGIYFSQTTKHEPAVSPSLGAFSQEVGGALFIHVVGEVNEPGLFELKVGSRVQDALTAAGGLTENAVQGSVNLARMLSDGEQIVVLSVDQMAGSGESSGYISLNQATQEQLESLSGVGPALAGRILEYKKANGSFSDLDQLREVSGIGAKLFESISKELTL
jgi:competence protein ComEA